MRSCCRIADRCSALAKRTRPPTPREGAHRPGTGKHQAGTGKSLRPCGLADGEDPREKGATATARRPEDVDTQGLEAAALRGGPDPQIDSRLRQSHDSL